MTTILAVESVVSQAAVWIDVRAPAEYETGHLPGAYNIDFEQINTRISEITKDRDTQIFVYCRSGRRSDLAKTMLEELGFLNVVNAGGIEAVLRHAAVQAITGPDCTNHKC